MAQELATSESQPLTLFGAASPAEVTKKFREVADELATVIRSQGLATRISNREHVRVEGWTLLGTMLGVFPVITETKEVPENWRELGLEKPDGYWSRCEARTRDGQLVGAGEAYCLFQEANWKNRDRYALLSMSQTRSVSKALRHPLGFVVTLAGYAETPAEEMTAEYQERNKAKQQRKQEKADQVVGEFATYWKKIAEDHNVTPGKLLLMARATEEGKGVQSLEGLDPDGAVGKAVLEALA